MTIGDRIKELRLEQGLNQRDLAAKMNISNSTLSQYETGQRAPSDDMKDRFACYFNVSIDYLMGRTNMKRPTVLEDDGPRNDKERLILELFRQAPDALQDLALEALRQRAADREKQSEKKE